MKQNLKNLIDSLGLNFKFELLKFVFINAFLILAAVLAFIFLKQIFILIFIIFIGAAIDFFYLTRYTDLDRKIKEKHNSEFVSLLSYFEIFISNNKNVYTSFQLILPYASLWMKEKIEIMLKEIDQDKTVKPFINFSKNFTAEIIQSVMLSIFQMVDTGENTESMNQFNFLFLQMSSNQQLEKIKRKEGQLESLNSLPLFGAGAICVTLILSILVIVGGMINGI